jgi:hypothetical protein
MTPSWIVLAARRVCGDGGGRLTSAQQSLSALQKLEILVELATFSCIYSSYYNYKGHLGTLTDVTISEPVLLKS